MKRVLSICVLSILFACNDQTETESTTEVPAPSNVQQKGNATLTEEQLAQIPENARLVYRHNQNLQVMEAAEADKLFLAECKKLLTKKGIAFSGLSEHEIVKKTLTLRD